MKNYSIEEIKSVYARKGYKLFRGYHNVNLIGIRNKDRKVNIFNDRFHLIYEDASGNTVQEVLDCTVDPGLFYLQNPMNANGTAILKCGQYIGSHKLGAHQGKYMAFVQKSPMVVFRDGNKDKAFDFGNEQTGVFGINIHRANANWKSKQVDKWSAGCTVISDPNDFMKLMDIASASAELYGNSFSYTLLDESDFETV